MIGAFMIASFIHFTSAGTTCWISLTSSTRPAYGNIDPNYRRMRYGVLVFTLLTACMTKASAQIYRCKHEKGNWPTQRLHAAKGAQTLTDISTSPTLPSSPNDFSLSRQLDNAVRRAIASGDLNQAGSLAVTSQHWEWIATAKRDSQPRSVLGRTEADLSAEKSGPLACQQATRAYEFEAGSYK
jgi:hypothetical protein